MNQIVIAIDCMGGDFGPPVTIAAVKKSLATHPDCQFLLTGDPTQINAQLRRHRILGSPRLTVIASEDDVLMSDKPSVALKSKKRSSMRLALEAVRDGRANACVSAGNTGALMAISRFILRMLPGIDRPAIISAIPTLTNRPVWLLDLGANVDCDASRLVQFAVMGNELSKSLDGIESPRVALLNVGEEDIKGSEELKKAANRLSQMASIQFCGFAEGNQIFSGDYEVIVTDGFTGNNVLKASEGLSVYLAEKIRAAFERNWWTRLCGLLARPVIKAFKAEINPEKYNGANLIGLRGIVIKSHGAANVNATCYAIDEAISQARLRVPQKIRTQLESLLSRSGEASDKNIA